MPMNWSSLPILVAGWASGERANVLGMGAEKVSGSIFFFENEKKYRKFLRDMMFIIIEDDTV